MLPLFPPVPCAHRDEGWELQQSCPIACTLLLTEGEEGLAAYQGGKKYPLSRTYLK